MTSLANRKNLMRQEALVRRAAMDPVARTEAGLKLVDFVEDLPLQGGETISGFWPIRDEIDPRPLLAALRERGHPLCLPVVADPHLIFRAFQRDSEFVPAGFGTFAPGPEAAETFPDVLLMPLAAFDSWGNRIGYGKGHYDTALAALEKTRKVLCIGLAFGLQEVEQVPAEPHDRPLDGILTEAGYRSFSNS